jgi:HlyD family secretion protein
MTVDTPRSDSAARRLAALFPDEHAVSARRPWYRRTGVVVAVVVIVVLAGALVATQAFGGSGDSYRTADASIEDVDAVQTGVATIEPVAQAAVAFPVSGTVASVNVAVGDHVEAGGTLASLDTTALARTLHDKQAALAQAQLTLDKGMAGQSISLGSGGAGGGAGGSGGSGGGGASATSTAARVGGGSTVVLAAATTDPALAAARQAVVSAPQHVDAALADATTALTAETSVCAAFTSPPAPVPPTTTTAPGGSGSSDLTACQQAVTAVTSAQSAVSTAQQALASASSNLDALLATATPPSGPSSSPSSSPSSGPSSGPSSSAPTGGGGGGSAGSGGTSRSASNGGGFGPGAAGPSAADLVAAQRDVDAATMAVLAAQQSVDQATIASPLAGTVVAVDMKVGDAVSAASSTEDVVIEGAGGYEVSTTIGIDQIPAIAVGQTATVVPDGGHQSLSGKVVAISIAPTSSTTAATTYRVVVGLTRPDVALHDGATGTVDVVTRHARAALAVPTSAIVTVRNRHFVNVLHDGRETLTPVQVGVVGSTWTEIRSGIARGTAVVLADVSAPLPGSATSSSNGTQTTTPFGGFGRRFGGGTGGAGGAGGGFGRTGVGG